MPAPNASRFLGHSTRIETGHPDTVLVHAPFDASAFEQDLFDHFGVPFPDSLARAVDKRRADYLAGRALLIRAFDALGHAPQHVARGADRAPLWPAGFVGSLSHSRRTCACLLSTNTALRVGLDVETTLSSDSERAVRKVALTPSEQALAADAPDLPALIFSGKETLFKALYPVVQAFFGFDAAELVAPPDAHHLRLRLTRTLHPTLPRDAVFTLRHRILEDHILTWLIDPV